MRTQRRRQFRVRLLEAHSANQQSRGKKRKRIQHENCIAPSSAPTKPPRVAPSTRFMDQVVEESVFARTKSSRVVMLGMTELRAGSKKAAMMVSSRSNG